MPAEFTPRSCLFEISAYAPGKSIASVERELGLKRVVKLASNENPLGPSPKALREFRKASADLALYPEGSSPELRRALAEFHGLERSRIIVGNGSDEIIRLLCEAFLNPGDEAVLSRYAFARFRQQVMLMGARPVEVPMRGWTHDLDAMAAACGARAKLLFVANPNNPTGTHNTEEELRRLLARVPASVLVVLDEAYYQFARSKPGYPESLRRLLPAHRNVVVLRTLSKAYGLAGLRLGYGAADPEIIGWLDRIRMPFNVNLPAQRAAAAALSDETFVRRSVALVERGRRSLPAEIEKLGFSVESESAANFLFVRCPMPGADLFRRLLRLGIIVRPLGEYGLPQHVRISLGTPEQNKALLAALKKTAAPAAAGAAA